MNAYSKHNSNTPAALARKSIAILAIGAAAALGQSCATAAPLLGAHLASFAVLAATGITNVPVSTIGGNLGSAPNGSLGGGYVFTSGSFQSNTSTAQNAQIELDAAISALSAFGVGTNVGGGDLDSYQSLHGGAIAPGTYTVSAAATNLMGNLFLDGAVTAARCGSFSSKAH